MGTRSISPQGIEKTTPDGSLSAASLTSVTTTATFTSTAAHGYSTGDVVAVSGAVETNYNVTATITVTSTTAFTYTITATTSPATGSPVVVRTKVVQRTLATSPCRIYTLSGYNDSGSTQILQLHDLATTLTDEQHVIGVAVASQTAIDIRWTLGRPLSNGLAIGWSLLATGDTEFAAGVAGLLDATFIVN